MASQANQSVVNLIGERIETIFERTLQLPVLKKEKALNECSFHFEKTATLNRKIDESQFGKQNKANCLLS
jgi:hypothetical protein